MKHLRQDRTVSCALWAAYGDILGFPTELVDEAGVQRRLGSATSNYPRSWKRVVGGKLGAWVELNAGCYSDDTQLRLSTSRAIREDGYFDVESFAKIELPVWLSYSLGAGRSSKLAAAALSQRNANWFSNFFQQRELVYTNGGGNGAAMRVQPHVWAAQDLGNPATYLPDVIQNTLCTHGHPRGIAGAIIHAVCLALVLQNGEIPPPSDWKVFGSFISVATGYIEENPDLSTFWLPTWNARTGTQFAEEMEGARIEWENDVATCTEFLSNDRHRAYEKILSELHGLSPEQRGSGLKSALFSLVAAWLYRDVGVEEALVSVVNRLGSDTDTIGTMTGALLGALHPHVLPSGPIQDREYITNEAHRLYRVSQEACYESFSYPNMLNWQPPRSQSDVVSVLDDHLYVMGLGPGKAVSEEYFGSQSDASWQWIEMEFGQTILCKRRRSLSRQLAENEALGYQASARASSSEVRASKRRAPKAEPNSRNLFSEDMSISANPGKTKAAQEIPTERSRNELPHRQSEMTLDEITDEIIRSGFDPTQVGTQLLRYADLHDGTGLAVAYAAIIVKARAARLKRKS